MASVDLTQYFTNDVFSQIQIGDSSGSNVTRSLAVLDSNVIVQEGPDLDLETLEEVRAQGFGDSTVDNGSAIPTGSVTLKHFVDYLKLTTLTYDNLSADYFYFDSAADSGADNATASGKWILNGTNVVLESNLSKRINGRISYADGSTTITDDQIGTNTKLLCPVVHTSSSAGSYGAASTSLYGHVRLAKTITDGSLFSSRSNLGDSDTDVLTAKSIVTLYNYLTTKINQCAVFISESDYNKKKTKNTLDSNTIYYVNTN